MSITVKLIWSYKYLKSYLLLSYSLDVLPAQLNGGLAWHVRKVVEQWTYNRIARWCTHVYKKMNRATATAHELCLVLLAASALASPLSWCQKWLTVACIYQH